MSTSFGRCSICTLPFELDDIASLKCGHTYHLECITKWIEHAKNCPKCRMKNTLRDITRLFVDEPDNTFSFAIPSNNAEMQEKVTKLEKELKDAKEAKAMVLRECEQCERDILALRTQLDKEKRNAAQLKLRDQQIKKLEELLTDQNSLKQKLELSNRRLRASQFYALLASKKDADQENIEKTIDKFASANGDPSVGEFLKMCTKQKMKVDKEKKYFNEQWRKERMDNNKLQAELARAKTELEEAQKELAESRKRRVQSTNGESPASSNSRRPRPSMGFSFYDNDQQQDENRNWNNDSDIQILTSGPLPQPKRVSFSCVALDDQLFTFDAPKQPKANKGVTKKPYLGDELAEIFSPKLLASAENSNVKK